MSGQPKKPPQISEISMRDRLYSEVLQNYVNTRKALDQQRRRLRNCFFWIISASFLCIIFCCLFVIITLSKKARLAVADVSLVLSSAGGIIGSIIVLPKIIAKHLFPKDGDKSDTELVFRMQEFDTKPNLMGRYDFWDGGFHFEGRAGETKGHRATPQANNLTQRTTETPV